MTGHDCKRQTKCKFTDFFYRPQPKFGEGYVFTSVCLFTGVGGYAWSQVPSTGWGVYARGRGRGYPEEGQGVYQRMGVGIPDGGSGIPKGGGEYVYSPLRHGTWDTHPHHHY